MWVSAGQEHSGAIYTSLLAWPSAVLHLALVCVAKLKLWGYIQAVKAVKAVQAVSIINSVNCIKVNSQFHFLCSCR